MGVGGRVINTACNRGEWREGVGTPDKHTPILPHLTPDEVVVIKSAGEV